MRKHFFIAQEQWSYIDHPGLSDSEVKALFIVSGLLPKDVLRYFHPKLMKDSRTIMTNLTSRYVFFLFFEFCKNFYKRFFFLVVD